MSARRGNEPNNVDTGALVLIAAGMAGVLVLVVALMYLIWRGVASVQPQMSDHSIPPRPRLQARPPIDRLVLDAEQRRALETYSWIDGHHQFARVPIDRAMSLLASGTAAPDGSATATTTKVAAQ